ncbi:MAG: hypothetical protein MJ184_12900 [Treponema sp.]|uniref:hypothetical protein n=1 Tax=Treponema sp. TaxID=166 RepID=UPI00298D601F|nr:hypothetical protein [Treponema sp.]MCQ2602252.1 hypothetical protein [Treponema sp.]
MRIDVELSTIGEQWLQLLKDNDLGTEDEYISILEVIELGIFGSAHTSKTNMFRRDLSTMGMNLEKNGIHYKEIKLDTPEYLP